MEKNWNNTHSNGTYKATNILKVWSSAKDLYCNYTRCSIQLFQPAFFILLYINSKPNNRQQWYNLHMTKQKQVTRTERQCTFETDTTDGGLPFRSFSVDYSNTGKFSTFL